MEQKVIEKLYQNFKREVLASRDGNDSILKAQDFGFFSWSNYPGVYTDQAIEEKLESSMLPEDDIVFDSGDEHYIYIATRLFEVGGHSRCILHFIDNIRDQKHTVILTDQKKSLPANLASFFKKNNTEVLLLDNPADPLSNAQMLRAHIKKLHPSRILLFTHPNDLLPLVTFGKFHPCEILLFNHADHTFWIRGNWIDMVIDFRETGLKVTRLGRLLERSALLRLPVVNSYERDSRSQSKMNIGYSGDDLIIGTLTNINKVQTEKGEFSFVRLMLNWATATPYGKFLIIGLTKEQFQSLLFEATTLPKNLVCLGIVPEPEAYYKAFDFFVEPFPIGSALGIKEACKYGAIPIFSPHPCHLAGSFEAFHETIQELFSQPNDFETFERNLSEMVKMPKQKIEELSNQLKVLIKEHHRGQQWVKSLKRLDPKEAPASQSLSSADISQEAAYFREYVKKDTNVFFQELLGLKYLVSRKLMWKMLLGKYKVFTIHKMSVQNCKRIVWKTFRK